MAERAKQQQQQRRSSEDIVMQQAQSQQAQQFVPQQIQHQYDPSNQQQIQHQAIPHAQQAQLLTQQHAQQQHQASQHKVQQAGPNAETNGHGNGQSTPSTPVVVNSMSESQITMLKNQIMAFKLLNKNLPIRKNFGCDSVFRSISDNFSTSHCTSYHR